MAIQKRRVAEPHIPTLGYLARNSNWGFEEAIPLKIYAESRLSLSKFLEG